MKQRLDYTNIPAVCIAAVADDNGSTEIGKDSFTYQQEVWASKADAKAAVKYTLDKISIPFTDGATINSNVSLPEQGLLGATIAWTSSDNNILREDGTVLGNGPVTLTLKITKDDLVYTREYSLHVDKGGEGSYIDGTTSGIKGIKTGRAMTDGRTFNLSGQRVSNNYKGIVVVNGKKIVRR